MYGYSGYGQMAETEPVAWSIPEFQPDPNVPEGWTIHVAANYQAFRSYDDANADMQPVWDDLATKQERGSAWIAGFEIPHDGELGWKVYYWAPPEKKSSIGLWVGLGVGLVTVGLFVATVKAKGKPHRKLAMAGTAGYGRYMIRRRRAR